MNRSFIFVCVGIAFACMAGAQNEGNFVMQRLHDNLFTPGENIDVQIIFDAPDSSGIKAIGLTETIPQGWVFVGTRSVEGALLPAVQPPVGRAGTLEFAWIDIPDFPYTFVYTLHVPDGEGGEAAIINGQVEYRLDGPAQFAAPVVTSISQSTRKQGLFLVCSGGEAPGVPDWTDLFTLLAVSCVLLVTRQFQTRAGKSISR